MLFEIELNPDFKILNSRIFLEEKDFKKFYKSNNLNDGYDDNIDDYLSEEHILNVDDESILANQDISVYYVYYEEDEILGIINSSVYSLCGRSDEKKLYPEWMLFYIAVKKRQVDFIYEATFNENLDCFKYIAEMRYKEYVIRNVRNFISPFTKSHHIDEIRDTLQDKYLEYVRSLDLDTERLFNFLDFLYDFHYRLKDNEKYKLMWNVETYIDSAIHLLNEQGFSFEDIYLRVANGMRGTYSALHSIYIYKPLYIKESKDCFSGYLTNIKSIFGDNISLDDLMDTIITKPDYENLIFSYIELIERFDSNKTSEIVMSSLTRSIMLDIEEVLREKLDCASEQLYDGCIRKLCQGSHLLNSYYRLITPDISNDDFFNRLKELSNKDDSLEKYLMIYYHSRNYLAHKNIDLHRFFEIEDGKRMVDHVISSMIIVLYKIETLEQ